MHPHPAVDLHRSTLSINTHTHTVDPPSITTDPIGLSNTIPGNTAVFTVVATGPNLAYQWELDGVQLTDTTKYSGLGTAQLTVNALSHPDDEGLYRVVVSNEADSVTSASANLDIGKQLYIIMVYTQ